MTMTTKAPRQRGTGSLYKNGKGGLWWMKYYRNGVPIRESSKSSLRREAEAQLKQRLGESDDTYTPTRLKKVTVAELIEDLIREYRVNDRKSIGHIQARWKHHLKPIFGDRLAVQVTSEAISRYVDGRKKEGAANASVNRELAIMKRALKLAMRCTPPKVKTMPHITMLKESNTRTGFLSSKDRDRLADDCAKAGLWMRALFECAYSFGWRHQELLGLKVRQVNLVTGTIRLEPNTTKNSDGREVPLTDAVFTLLKACVIGKQPGDHVFTHDDGSPVLDFRSTWANVCVEAGVGKFICRSCQQPVDEARRCAACKRTWRRNDLGYDLGYEGLIFHDLRRSAARNLRNQGIGEGVIMKIGGWKTRTVFDRYSIIDQGDMTDAMRKLEAGRRRETETAKQETEAFGHKTGIIEPNGEDSVIDTLLPAPLRN